MLPQHFINDLLFVENLVTLTFFILFVASLSYMFLEFTDLNKHVMNQWPKKKMKTELSMAPSVEFSLFLYKKRLS